MFRLAGGALEPVDAFDHASGRETWHTPWGGPPDTRSMANWEDELYVNVHVGGILRSDDEGDVDTDDRGRRRRPPRHDRSRAWCSRRVRAGSR